MNKYIDADCLRAEINKTVLKIVTDALDPDAGIERVASAKYRKDALKDVLSLIDSLQQEQPQVADASKMEQPEVDLEKEIDDWYNTTGIPVTADALKETARHFYGLRNRALEEAALHVYESWMGGTMDDVRRDMVELGKVLNARKEE